MTIKDGSTARKSSRNFIVVSCLVVGRGEVGRLFWGGLYSLEVLT